MYKGLGVKFRKFNNIAPLKGYKEGTLNVGSPVIVETERGVEYGWIVVVVGEKGRHAGSDIKLKKVLRYAGENDTACANLLEQKEKEAFCSACNKIKEYDLPVKLLQVEILFDESKIILYYKVIDSKKTFSNKEIVKDISGVLGKKVEMHPLSPRDEARIMSGIGPCGRQICCSAFLSDFPHISVKMLKEQGIAINQTKICGICGKLLCCLKYEYEGKK
jgi:cell fate regulator YaaT (PSP1 superfamily)